MKLLIGITPRSQRIIILAVTFAAILATLYATSRVPLLARTFSPPDTAQSPTVYVLPQPGVPLLISSAVINLANPSVPQIDCIVTNVSDKPIQSYAVLRNVSGDKRSYNLTLNHILSLDSVFQPFQTRPESLIIDSEPIKSITLSIDFVEFIDGSTWGDDTCRSAERLAGQRAGARAAKDHLIKKVGNPSALLNAVAAGEADVDLPPGHSPSWEEGFHTGTGVMRERLRDAKSKGGLAEVERELKQPYDASEGRQKQ
jgi:hypothetical protein